MPEMLAFGAFPLPKWFAAMENSAQPITGQSRSSCLSYSFPALAVRYNESQH